MVRLIILLLLFAVFFLSGMVYQADGDNQVEGPPAEQEEPVQNEARVEVAPPTESPVNQTIADEQSNDFIPGFAGFLEQGVTAFFEMIVGIMYGIAELFF